MNDNTANYSVKMMDAEGVSEAERSAAELRFRMALEAGVGGRGDVLPTLQACMLARLLTSGLSSEEMAGAAHDAEREVIALWEKAEDRAIMTALKPFGRDLGQARFEIGF